ncbi:MAG: glycosyltransferase family 2 protein [Candidatus Pacebacteria bacterium]|nr:glycosyltransferase family 2 protein [Candidatus Paceibacterota bacterium]
MQDYLKIGKASDLERFKERIVYRIFEILPGFFSLLIIFLAVILSWLFPFWVALFIITFVIYWFFRTIYFSFYLWTGYKKMEKNEKVDWIEKLNQLPSACYQISDIDDWKEIYHLIVIPMYEESLLIIKDTLNSIKNSDYPKGKMIIVLGCEEKVRNSAEPVALEIEKEFKDCFFKFLVTWHPDNIFGEIAGKGSNETWAAKKAKEFIIDELKIPYQNIIFSSFDADTCIFPKYFSCLTYYYLTSKEPTRTSYQPIPFYINNIWQAPVISRIFAFSSTFWHTMNQERPEKLITFSSHSMSFSALTDVGFKQINVVSDDSRIFWQCFLKYDGNYRVKPIYYPISMDANAAKNFIRTMINIYKQQRRWAYGVADIPYFLFGFIKNKKIPFSKKFNLSFELIGEHISWTTASILIFALGWLPLFLGRAEFSQTLISYNLPRIMSRILTISMIGLISSIYFSFLILPPKPPDYGPFKYLVFIAGWFLFPLTMVFFLSLPAFDAQIRLMLGKYMGFWVTEKERKE